MKKGIIAVMALSIAFYFSSCTKKGGMSEETKTAMTTFETAWSATGDQLNGWGTTMNTTHADMNKMMDASMSGDMSKMKPAEKAHMDSMMMMCTPIKAGMEGMKSEYNAAMEQWKADTQAYADWKKKGQEEKMTDEQINAGLAEWNTKLAAWNTKMSDWNQQLTSMQAACKTACDSMMM